MHPLLHGLRAALLCVVVSSLAAELPEGSGSFEFRPSGNPDRPVTVWTHVPAGLGADAPVVFVFHGVGRNGAEYHASWVQLAEDYRFLLLTPEFSREAWETSRRYNQGNVQDEKGRPLDPAQWSFTAVEEIFDRVRAEHGLTARGYRVFGHSAGGQFVHRFCLALPQARWEMAVAANAGWYTMPDFGLAYPYGLLDGPMDAAKLEAALAKPLFVLLGTKDNDPWDDSLSREPGAMAQGPFRLARGENFFTKALDVARARRAPFAWELAYVPGVAHEYQRMAPAAAALLFRGHGAPRGTPEPPAADTPRDWVVAVHGGAGTVDPDRLAPAARAEYCATLARALRAGAAVAEAGGEALNAAQAAVRVLEDSPLFNAGKGAVMTAEGGFSLDAAVMRGTDRAAGAVAGVSIFANPVDLARHVMAYSPHVLLAGEGAEAFGRAHALPTVPPAYFFTQRRADALARSLGGPPAPGGGTVGAVVRDRQGRLAAAISTGGLTGKRWGRVGDSPIVGAGLWADDATVAVACTGQGEYFIRAAAAHSVHARMRHGGQSLAEAAAAAIFEDVAGLGGTGGLIAVDREGRVALPFNTSGMYRGYLGPDGLPAVFIGPEREN